MNDGIGFVDLSYASLTSVSSVCLQTINKGTNSRGKELLTLLLVWGMPSPFLLLWIFCLSICMSKWQTRQHRMHGIVPSVANLHEKVFASIFRITWHDWVDCYIWNSGLVVVFLCCNLDDTEDLFCSTSTKQSCNVIKFSWTIYKTESIHWSVRT